MREYRDERHQMHGASHPNASIGADPISTLQDEKRKKGRGRAPNVATDRRVKAACGGIFGLILQFCRSTLIDNLRSPISDL
jgi:hypothetical protein